MFHKPILAYSLDICQDNKSKSMFILAELKTKEPSDDLFETIRLITKTLDGIKDGEGE